MTRANCPIRRASAPSVRRVLEPGTPECERVLAELWRRSEQADRESMLRRFWFAQLSASLGIAPAPLAELGLPANATEQDVRRAYRRLALERHPDRGGSAEAFRTLTEAYQAALRAVRP